MGFVFERNFDVEQEQESAARNAPAPARFTVEDLQHAAAQARAEALEQGRAEGRAAAEAEQRDSDRRHHLATIDVVARGIADLFGANDTRVNALEQQILAYLLAVFEKLAPDIMATLGPARAQAEVRRAMTVALGAARLRIYLPKGADTALTPDLAQAAAADGFGGRVDVLADFDLAPGDARVEWDSGFMDYSFDRICNSILTSLRAALPDGAPDSEAATDQESQHE